MSQKKPEYSVEVLSRTDLTSRVEGKGIIPVKRVSYYVAGIGVRSITIPLAEYGLEVEKKAIRADIELALKEKPETYTV